MQMSKNVNNDVSKHPPIHADNSFSALMNINILSLINTCVVNTGTKISVLKKCRLKLNRSIQFEMLFIKDKKLTLNIQSDPLKQTFLFDISSAPRLVFSFIIYWLFFSLNRMYWDCHTYIHFIMNSHNVLFKFDNHDMERWDVPFNIASFHS